MSNIATMKSRNVLYAQSGGVTAVINATAAGVIEAGRKSSKINKILAAKNGILGALKEELIELALDFEEINLALNPELWEKVEELTGGERITPVMVTGDNVEVGFHGVG